MTTLRVFYGGTFDPVHEGHLAIARAAHAALDATVRLMPAADPPHRAPTGADDAQRAAMLDLAVAGDTGLTVDRRELRRGGRSYTVDTLHALREEFGSDAPIVLLVGADSFIGLPTWKDWKQLFGLAHFVVAERPGSALDDVLLPALAVATESRWTTDAANLRQAPSGRVLRLRQPLHPASASEVRRRIAARGDWRPLVPAAVADYIVRHRLYLNGGAQRQRL